MSPKANDFDRLDAGEDLIYEAVLDVYAPGIRAGEIPHQFLEGRRVLEGVRFQYPQKGFRLRLQAGRGKLFRVFLRLLGKNEMPVHQSSFLAVLLMGVLRPARMDSRIPGMESR